MRRDSFLRRAAQTWAPYCVYYLVTFYTISSSHSSGVVNTVFRFVSFRLNKLLWCRPFLLLKSLVKVIVGMRMRGTFIVTHDQTDLDGPY